MGWSRQVKDKNRSSVTLLCGVLLVSLVLGASFLAVNRSGPSGAPSQPADPLTDDQAAAQVVDSAKEIVRVAQLREATGGYIFVSCKNEHDPPYQAAVYMNFQLPHVNSVKYLREVVADMVAHGWKEATTMGEHFGKKLTKDGATAVFYRNPDDLDYGTMRLYGECRNMTDHRNDNPAWTEVTDRLPSIRG